MTLPDIAVTGVTGFVGGHVARELADAGVAQRLLARMPASAPVLPGAVPMEVGSYGDGPAVEHALRGATTVFLVSGRESADRVDQHLTFVAAAQAAGVHHVVYTSFVGAAPDAVFTLARDHYRTEEAILASGMTHTFLRDNLYLDFLESMVGEDGVIRGPADAGRAAVVARADVARTAAAVLLDPGGHEGVTYELTGPQALTLAEVADVISSVRGTSVRFHDETLAEAYRSRERWGAPGWQVDAWVSTYTAIASGVMERVSPDVERVTGRRPMSLAEFLRS